MPVMGWVGVSGVEVNAGAVIEGSGVWVGIGSAVGVDVGVAGCGVPVGATVWIVRGWQADRKMVKRIKIVEYLIIRLNSLSLGKVGY
jgi:hypothetical protein